MNQESGSSSQGNIALASQEIVLADQYASSAGPSFSQAQAIDFIEPADRVSLPAALCDDQLIFEIQSIPEKMGFKIGEVAELLGIKQYVLRYWESEFDVLKPKKAANNQRYYTKKDVENAYVIRKLLHRDRFSIEGARSAVRELKNFVKKEKDWAVVNHRIESLQDRMNLLLKDIQKAKSLFC